MASTKYYDTLADAKADTNLSTYTDIFTFGLNNKNDGGGAHYKQYYTTVKTPYLSFQAAGGSSFWGLVPDNGVVNPLQSQKLTDLQRIQECIDFIKWWNDTADSAPLGTRLDYHSNRSAIKLVLPANHAFTIDMTAAGATGLRIQSPITIEGEDPVTSKIMMVETLITPPAGAGIGGDGLGGASLPGSGNLILAEGPPSQANPAIPDRIRDIRLRNFALMGSYLGNKDYGKAPLRFRRHAPRHAGQRRVPRTRRTSATTRATSASAMSSSRRRGGITSSRTVIPPSLIAVS